MLQFARCLLAGYSVWLGCAFPAFAQEPRLQPITYNNPELRVDLGVGLWAWPLPMDYDGDGDLDLVVSCPDVPMNGTWFFENPGAEPGQLPVFRPPVRIAHGPTNVQLSLVQGLPVVMTPARIYPRFREEQYANPIQLPLPDKIDSQFKRYRANQWKLVDWEGDGDLDVLIGIGIWDDYGWDDAWDEQGGWKNGPLHGYIYLVENITPPAVAPQGNDVVQQLAVLARAEFADPRRLVTTGGDPVDVFGMPSPNLVDLDGDGDLDLLCGEFLDGFTWFENTGTRTAPQFAPGRKLVHQGAAGIEPLRMDLQMITPIALDWDGDGQLDLICGDEDGRVALLRGVRQPQQRDQFFQPPQYFQQQAADVKFGALVTPVGVDWDGDGDLDLVCGNTAGYIGLIENLGGRATPRWAAPRYLQEVPAAAAARTPAVIRYEAGPTGSIQGPCEAKWGYTTLSVADWNGDGRSDLVVNSIWGRVSWHQRLSGDTLLTAQPVALLPGAPILKPQWTWWTPEANQVAPQWRTTPVVVDWNQDGLPDLLMLDHEGYLAWYAGVEQNGARFVQPPQRLFKMRGRCEFDQKHAAVGDARDGMLRLNVNRAGGSGRRKLCVADWDGDGRLDLLVNSINVNWLRNTGVDAEGFVWFEDMGPLDTLRLAGHDTSPTTVDWDADGIPDLLVGAEDGRLYFLANPHAAAGKTP